MYILFKLLKLFNWFLYGCVFIYKFDLYNMELMQFYSECILKDVMIR